MNKYQLACIEYAKANKDYLRLTQEIGSNLSQCVGTQGQELARISASGKILAVFRKKQPCLVEWYEYIRGDDNRNEYGGYEIHPSEDPIDCCEHCERAHALIKDRKIARKTRGIALRRLSALGATSGIDAA